MNRFVLNLFDASHEQRIEGVTSFVGEDASGSFGIQAAKNVAFLTGIVIPEGKKLWSDRWPGYQRNIVNYAMPTKYDNFIRQEPPEREITNRSAGFDLVELGRRAHRESGGVQLQKRREQTQT